jgi:hypothetical protein
MNVNKALILEALLKDQPEALKALEEKGIDKPIK